MRTQTPDINPAAAGVSLASATFDACRDGGLPGTQVLPGDLVPAGAVVLDALLRIDKPFALAVLDRQESRARRRHDRLTFRRGERALFGETRLSPVGWPAGHVLRAPQTAGRISVDATDQPVTVEIDSIGGFTTGRLSLAVTYLLFPPNIGE